MSIFRSISQALKTRKLESPLSISLKSMANYIRSNSAYEWVWVEDGDQGRLDRGFGRSYSIFLNKRTASLTVSAKTESRLAWLCKNEKKEYALTEEQEREISLSISDAIVNAPAAPEAGLLAAMLGMVLLLIAIAARRSH